MKAGTVLDLSRRRRRSSARLDPDGPTIYQVPPGSTYRFGDGPDQTMVFHEAFRAGRSRAARASKADPGRQGLVLPEEARRLVPGSSWGTFTIACTIPIALFVGWYMYRFRKGKVVEASLIGAVAVLAATVGGAFDPRLAARAVLLAVAETDDLRHRRLRVRRGGPAGLALALPARLPVELPQDRHDRAAGRRRDRGQPEARGAGGQPASSPRAAGPTSTGRSSPTSSSASCAARSPGFHALVSSGTTPKMVDRESRTSG